LAVTRREGDHAEEVKVRIDRGVEGQLKVVEVDPAQFSGAVRLVNESRNRKRLSGLVVTFVPTSREVGNDRKIWVEAILGKYSRG
jgi:hypothetical protein